MTVPRWPNASRPMPGNDWMGFLRRTTREEESLLLSLPLFAEWREWHGGGLPSNMWLGRGSPLSARPSINAVRQVMAPNVSMANIPPTYPHSLKTNGKLRIPIPRRVFVTLQTQPKNDVLEPSFDPRSSTTSTSSFSFPPFDTPSSSPSISIRNSPIVPFVPCIVLILWALISSSLLRCLSDIAAGPPGRSRQSRLGILDIPILRNIPPPSSSSSSSLFSVLVPRLLLAGSGVRQPRSRPIRLVFFRNFVGGKI
mmetsp:Transcript_5370/g.13436  ORF Transcript_5370/g.13436 Transcript_5370/m.13436 type:complete len:254 (-) Transcript_5370:261-1022(-)